MRGRIASIGLVLVVLGLPAKSFADAAADLAAGRTALQQGRLDAALPLLKGASEALPDSVEARLSLAECRLRLGHVAEALDDYRAVLRKSPEHAEAKRLVATLTGQTGTFAQKLDAARLLTDVAAWPEAIERLSKLVDDPDAGERRHAARLLLAEARLWANADRAALLDALRVIQESPDEALRKPARVVAALALAVPAERRAEPVRTLLEQAGELAEPWASRAAIADALLQLDDPLSAAATSKRLTVTVDALRNGAFRQAIVARFAQSLFDAATGRLDQGDSAGAFEILWPMLGGGDAPVADAVPKPIDLSGGWLVSARIEGKHRTAAGRTLLRIGQSEFDRDGRQATLLPFWLAGELLRQSPRGDSDLEPRLLELVARLGALSRPATTRRTGEILSRADALQRRLLVAQSALVVGEEGRKQLVQLVLQHVARYQAVGDLATGLTQFVEVDAAAKPLAVRLVGDLQKLPPGGPRAALLAGLATSYAEVGQREFRESLAAIVGPGPMQVAPSDAVALAIFGELTHRQPGEKSLRTAAEAIVERYAAARRWDAAAEAIGIWLAAEESHVRRWAVVRLRLREVAAAEDELLASRRGLGAEPSASLKTALAEAAKIAVDVPTEESRRELIGFGEALVARYSQLERDDLAEAVIAALSAPQGPSLADWTAWARAGLLHRRADRALDVAAARIDDVATLPLVEAHVAEIALLNSLIDKHPGSPYADDAVERVQQIADGYRIRGAFATAKKTLTDFLAAHPKLAAKERIEYRLVEIEIARAGAAFAARPNPTVAPSQLLAEHLAAIDALAAFLKAHPVGKESVAAGAELFAVARTYASAGAWNVARTVLERYAAAIPDLRSPAQMKFLRAVTHLGELDPTVALALLTPQPGDAAVPKKDAAAATIATSGAQARHDERADAAYALLIELIDGGATAEPLVARLARGQILRLFDFFERQERAERAIALIQRFLKDRPGDPDRVALAFRIVGDRLAIARRQKPEDKRDSAWLRSRHDLFEAARRDIAAFATAHADDRSWREAAHRLAFDSYLQEAAVVAPVSRERAAGVLVQSVDALLRLRDAAPDAAANVPAQMNDIAERLAGLQRNEQAIDVLQRIAREFPTHEAANRSLLRIAQLHATNLANPLRAVETFQEYLNRSAGDPAVPSQIFAIGQQLAERKRYLEALHVFGAFVDGFPTDPQAAAALHAIGRTHQANGAWEAAIATYERIFEEYPQGEAIPQTQLDVAQCRISLGEWRAARRIYEQYLEKFPQQAGAALARSRLEILKRLERFQDLIADKQIDRNKDDAQFQIGVTVLKELADPVKAVDEFRKVATTYPQSDLADDAQLEIGKALLALGRLEEGRAALLAVPQKHSKSPLADDALFLIAQSYERFAQELAGVTLEKAREESHAHGQREAYSRFNRSQAADDRRSKELREQLKERGDDAGIALNAANDASRGGSLVVGRLFCEVTQAELQAETESALQLANRRDRIHDALRQAVALYSRAYSDYPLGDTTDRSLQRIAHIQETQLKDRPAAMLTYRNIARLFPGTPVAEEAAWKVAEFYVEEGKYVLAAEAYNEFIRNFPASPRVADAQFGMGEALEHLGRWVDAMDAYETFRQKFSQHPKARLAAEQIGWIKTYRK